MSVYDNTIIDPNTTGVASYQPSTMTPSQVATPDVVAPVMNTAQANSVLNQYGIDTSNTLSASNIAQTIKRPTAAPDDLLGIREQINYDLGLPAAQKAYQDALAAARGKVNDLNKTSAVMEGQRLNLGVIRGEQAQARTLAAPEIERLQYQSALEQDRLNALTAERDWRVQVAEQNINFVRNLKLQYPGAKVNFGDSMDKIESKIVKYQKDQEDKIYKDELKKQMMSLGLSTKTKKGGTMKTKDMEKAVSKYNKEAAKYAKEQAKMKTESDKIALSLQKIQLQKAQSSQVSGSSDDADFQRFMKMQGGSQTQTGLQPTDWNSIINGTLSGLTY